MTSNLPDLPKKNKTREANTGLDFRHEVEKAPHKFLAGSYEMKDTRGKIYMPYREITDEQFRFGMAAKSDKGVLVRVQSGTVGASDYIFLRRSPAYVVIKYPDCMCMIDIETLVMEKNKFKKKSLSVERAKAIAIKIL